MAGLEVLLMCGGKVVKQDPEGDARKTAEEAAIKANAKTALRNKLRSQSVLSGETNTRQNNYSWWHYDNYKQPDN